MITENDLSTAANTIRHMSHTELQRKLRELKDAHTARSRQEVIRQQSELDSLELEQAAYKLASHAEATGDLPGAARWYRAAALNDFADSQLRLARVLDIQAEQCMLEEDKLHARRQENELYAEACRWYGDAYAAGHLEAGEFLDKMIERHATRRVPSRPALVVADEGTKPAAASCTFGGLQNVMARAMNEGADHVASCNNCQHEMTQPGALAAIRNSPASDAHESMPQEGGTAQRADFGRGPSPDPEPSQQR